MKKFPLKTTTGLLFLVFLDQIAKEYAKNNNLFTANDKGAFSMPISQIVTIFLSTIILLAFFYLIKTSSNSKLQKTAFVLIIAGGTGNLLDRVARQHVIDIISFHTAHLNLADIYIIFGTTILAFHLFFFSPSSQ